MSCENNVVGNMDIFGKTQIAMLVATTSRCRTWKTGKDCDFILKTFCTFVKQKSQQSSLKFYIAYDDDDPYYSNPSVRQEIIFACKEQIFSNEFCENMPFSETHATYVLKKSRITPAMHYTLEEEVMLSQNQASSEIKLLFMSVQNKTQGPCLVWNACFQAAVEDPDHNDYFYQLGDDVELLPVPSPQEAISVDTCATMDGKSTYWDVCFVETLKSQRNIGVTGGMDINHSKIHGSNRFLTQAMVGRPHYDIFGFLYPTEFRNWYSDNWLSEVYMPDYFRIDNVFLTTQPFVTPRYTPDQDAYWTNKAKVQEGKVKLRLYLESTFKKACSPE